MCHAFGIFDMKYEKNMIKDKETRRSNDVKTKWISFKKSKMSFPKITCSLVKSIYKTLYHELCGERAIRYTWDPFKSTDTHGLNSEC